MCVQRNRRGGRTLRVGSHAHVRRRPHRDHPLVLPGVGALRAHHARLGRDAQTEAGRDEPGHTGPQGLYGSGESLFIRYTSSLYL